MNGAHWHLVLNHLPLIIPMIGLLIMIGGVLLKLEIIRRVAFSIFIVGALSAIPAFYTGEGAEEVVEEISGVNERLIKVHEEIAETFSMMLYVLGGISLIGIWASWKRKSYSNTIAVVASTLAFVSLFYAQQTGTTGGEIRHTEIRNNNVAALNQKSSEADD